MAANPETSRPERNRKWYLDDLTEVNESIRRLLETYSKVPSAEVVKHVNKIRESSFTANPYPCIGLYRFLNLTLLTHPLYTKIVSQLSSSPTDDDANIATYLDIGCCFGQDLRQLVADGVPSNRLTGLDVAGPLMERGYDLFLDRDTLKSRFVVADVFKGVQQGGPWTDLEKKGFDVIHISAFFHLFSLGEQIAAAKQVAKLVRPAGVLVGRQVGSVKPGDVPAIQEGSMSYRHDVRSFDDMWKEVGQATGTKWQVTGTMDMVGIRVDSPVEDENSRRLLFTVTRVE